MAYKELARRRAPEAVVERASQPQVVLFADPREAESRLDRSGMRTWVDRAAGAALIGVAFLVIWRA